MNGQKQQKRPQNKVIQQSKTQTERQKQREQQGKLQTKQREQQGNPQTRQREQQGKPQAKSSSLQRQQTQQQKQLQQQSKQEQQEQRQKRDWKAYIYNSPYLIFITLTSLAVMFTSDEIGFSAVAREAQAVVCKSDAGIAGENRILSGNNGNTGDINNVIDEEREESEDEGQTASTFGNTGGAEEEISQEDSVDIMENAGIRKDKNDDLQNGDGLQDGQDSPENGVESEKPPAGITNYEFYEPVETDSRYYKDAGKIALTTQYSYTKENISYFDDAAFLGDSRTLGISDYAGLDGADFYCDSGMMIFKILEEEVTYQKTGGKVRMEEVLQEKQYGKIYIMLGMNELGYGNTEMYLDQYRKVLEQIRQWQPEAIIYIMANLHVSREKNNMETEFNNININSKNAASASLANGTDVFYLDVNPVFTDEEGYLKSELTFDGVHLYAKHYDMWREFLLEHAVEPARGKPSGTEQKAGGNSGSGEGTRGIPET